MGGGGAVRSLRRRLAASAPTVEEPCQALPGGGESQAGSREMELKRTDVRGYGRLNGAVNAKARRRQAEQAPAAKRGQWDASEGGTHPRRRGFGRRQLRRGWARGGAWLARGATRSWAGMNWRKVVARRRGRLRLHEAAETTWTAP